MRKVVDVATVVEVEMRKRGAVPAESPAIPRRAAGEEVDRPKNPA